MLRKLMLAVIPMVALTGMVKADDFGGLSDLDNSSFEAKALTAALTGDELVGDAEVLAVSGSEATEDIDAAGVCFYGGYYGCGYGYCGYRFYNCYSYCYRPVIYNYCAPVYGFYGHYCW